MAVLEAQDSGEPKTESTLLVPVGVIKASLSPAFALCFLKYMPIFINYFFAEHQCNTIIYISIMRLVAGVPRM